MCKAKAPRPRVFVVECGGRALHSLIIDQHRSLLRGPFGCWLRSANLVINLRALRDHHHHHQHTHTHTDSGGKRLRCIFAPSRVPFACYPPSHHRWANSPFYVRVCLHSPCTQHASLATHTRCGRGRFFIISFMVC